MEYKDKRSDTNDHDLLITTPQILVVTGYSGAGKNTVLHALEDIGFYCVDNLPINLLDSFFQLVVQAKKHDRIALGLDIRGVDNSAELIEYVQRLRHAWQPVLKIFFLTSSAGTLIRRFQETRRKHPLAHDSDLLGAINQERQFLEPLVAIADLVLDTDHLNIHELRAFVCNAFTRDTVRKIVVNIISFGFKYGVPLESNFVFDVRSLPNPYFVPHLRALSGLEQPVIDYLFAQSVVVDYWERFISFASYSIAQAHNEGRFFINLSIGCTGGRHRSVAFAQTFMQQQSDCAKFMVKHRDIDRL